MSAARYAAVKRGDEYVLERQAEGEEQGRTLSEPAVRSIAAFLGSGLILLGLSRRSIGGLIIGVAGGLMLYRVVGGEGMRMAGLRSRRERRRENQEIDEASMESFPASDAPAHTGTTLPL